MKRQWTRRRKLLEASRALDSRLTLLTWLNPLCPSWGIGPQQKPSTGLCSSQSSRPHPMSSRCLSSSLMTVRHQDSFGLHFLFPWEFHFIATQEVFSLTFLNVWPIHFHFLRFILLHLPVQIFSANSSSFVMIYGQNIPSIWRSLLLTNVCILESRVLVSRQVSDP